MAEEYITGLNRIVYRSTNFGEGFNIFVDLYNPIGSREPSIVLVEIGEGLYYFEYSFVMQGIYTGIFYENGVNKTSQNFRIAKNVSGGFRFLGHNVINTG